MWYGLRGPAALDSESESIATDVLRSTLRSLIYATGAIGAVWYLATALSNGPLQSLVTSFLVALCAVAAGGLALHVMPENPRMAQVIWLAGIAAGLFLAVYTSQQPQSVFLLALLPFAAAVTLGWPAGQYLDRQHTARHFRTEHWEPAIWSRHMLQQWLESGRQLDVDRAREVVVQMRRRIVEQGPEEFMSGDLERAVLHVIERARCALVGR